MATPLPTENRTTPKRRFNWVVSDFYRKVLVWKQEWRAKLTGRGYRCAALEGLSEYNITINSDQTVSCNCQDYEGIGQIGNLRNQSFEEVFHGPVAQRFRAELARGKMPIPTCVRCSDLQRLPAGGKAGETLPQARLPHRGIMLENTVRCNVDCTGCARENAAQLRVNKQLTMPLAEIEKMGDLVQRLGVRQLFYLNLGEPFLSPTIGSELPMLRKKNPDCRIVTSTNGVLLNTDAKREAALNFSHIFFSVHGITNEMSEKYMHRGHFDKAYEAMKLMAEYRNARGLTEPVLEWKYLLFNWNDKPAYLERAIEMAKAAKLDFISFWPTNNPFWGMSWRWRLGQLNRFGRRNWKGLEVDLRPEPLRGTRVHKYYEGD
jgi:MoaA/NifB/PqqE/SkfB family radical SAM enzyme